MLTIIFLVTKLNFNPKMIILRVLNPASDFHAFPRRIGNAENENQELSRVPLKMTLIIVNIFLCHKIEFFQAFVDAQTEINIAFPIWISISKFIFGTFFIFDWIKFTNLLVSQLIVIACIDFVQVGILRIFYDQSKKRKNLNRQKFDNCASSD